MNFPLLHCHACAWTGFTEGAAVNHELTRHGGAQTVWTLPVAHSTRVCDDSDDGIPRGQYQAQCQCGWRGLLWCDARRAEAQSDEHDADARASFGIAPCTEHRAVS